MDDAYTIGNDGSIGGTANDGDHPVMVSPDGKAHRLAELPGRPGGKVFALHGDWAVGWVPADTDSNLMSARWNLVTGELTPFPSVAGIPVGVAANGTVLAYLRTFGAAAVILPDGTLEELPPLPDLPQPNLPGRPSLPPGLGISFEVVGISSDATMVAGNNRVPTGASNVATVWRRTG